MDEVQNMEKQLVYLIDDSKEDPNILFLMDLFCLCQQDSRTLTILIDFLGKLKLKS